MEKIPETRDGSKQSVQEESEEDLEDDFFLGNGAGSVRSWFEAKDGFGEAEASAHEEMKSRRPMFEKGSYRRLSDVIAERRRSSTLSLLVGSPGMYFFKILTSLCS